MQKYIFVPKMPQASSPTSAPPRSTAPPPLPGTHYFRLEQIGRRFCASMVLLCTPFNIPACSVLICNLCSSPLFKVRIYEVLASMHVSYVLCLYRPNNCLFVPLYVHMSCACWYALYTNTRVCACVYELFAKNVFCVAAAANFSPLELHQHLAFPTHGLSLSLV